MMPKKKCAAFVAIDDQKCMAHKESLQTDYLEEMGISILCSMSNDENDHVDQRDDVVTLKRIKKSGLRKRACTWPAAMLVEFIDLAMISEIMNSKAQSSDSFDTLSVSDFEAETEREQESEGDTDPDCHDIEVTTIKSGKSSIKSLS